jgi:hypothetical protein
MASVNYPGRWIDRGRDAPISRPARPPDLNLLDFFCGGYFKTKTYATTVSTREELWRQIQQFSSELKNRPGIFERLRLFFCQS